MSNNLRLVLTLAFMTFYVTASVLAQTSTTGTVEGVITDSTGAVVPNVTVNLSGDNLLRSQTTTSDNEGVYKFLQIPPGKYTLKVNSAAGFNSFEQKNVEVNLSKTTSVNINLTPAGVDATVDVTAGSSEIDQNSNVTGTNVSTDFFSNIPTSRTVQGLYTIAPTVARSGLRDASGRDRDPSVAGSSGPENNYILDGVTTTDPAFGGGGANLPFEFVQEVEIKTGSYGADQGLSTGGVFNVITKSGGNEFHGDVFGYFSNKNLVRQTKNFPLTGLAPNGFSELDAGVDISGPILKNKLAFFAAFNPQYRKNYYLTQTFKEKVDGTVKTPFYAGKVTYSINDNNVFNFSTFGDYTEQKGFLFGNSGFGDSVKAFRGNQQTGGSNYAFRLNSNIGQNWIGEFSVGIHRQRSNLYPESPVAIPSITDNFSILDSQGKVTAVTQTGTQGPLSAGSVDYVYSPGGTLQRNYAVGEGFGLVGEQKRNRWEIAARLQTLWKGHTFKYGFEFYRNNYGIDQFSTGPNGTFANPNNVPAANGSDAANRSVNGYRVTNNFAVCTTRGTVIVCPNQAAIDVLNAGFAAGKLPTGLTVNQTVTAITSAEANNNPFLVRLSTRVRDYQLNAQTETDVQSFYLQDDWKIAKNFQINLGGRWDFQQVKGDGGDTYLKLNNFRDNFQPRVGFIWDFTGKGKGKFFANYARYLETPVPLDLNVRAGGGGQTDKQFNVSRYNAATGSIVASGFSTRNLGASATPIDSGLKPQTVNEVTVGGELEVKSNLTFGVRGIYRSQGSVIEDGSFDNGNTYFLFNPGEIRPGRNTTEELACNDPDVGCFGRARRYYRALEFTLNKRFSKNYSFVSSYVYSSLIGNYEGLFRNDNGQSDPNITSLFDLVSLLNNTYGRLPNDRPHQFKFNGNYETPWKIMVSANFYIQSGIPFNQFIPDPSGAYGNDEGLAVPRGTATIPYTGSTIPGGSNGVFSAIGRNRTPTTWNLDLGANYPIRINDKVSVKLMADWFNVTNSQRAVTLDNTSEITLSLEGVPNIPNPFYGSGKIFQYPSAFRFGAKLSF